MNYITTNETSKSDLIYNPSNKLISDNISLNSMGVTDINKIIKAFDEWGDVDILNIQSKAFTSNLKCLEKIYNKNDYNVKSKDNNYKKKMNSKKFIITKSYENDKKYLAYRKKRNQAALKRI